MNTNQQNQTDTTNISEGSSRLAAKSALEPDPTRTGSGIHRIPAGKTAKRAAVLFLALLLALSSWGGIAGAVSASAAVTASSRPAASILSSAAESSQNESGSAGSSEEGNSSEDSAQGSAEGGSNSGSSSGNHNNSSNSTQDSSEIAAEDQAILDQDISSEEISDFEEAVSDEEMDVDGDYDVAYTGDFSKVVSGYIVIYPKKLTDSSKKWPVIVWANGTACAPALYWNALCALASKGYIVVASSDTMSADGKSQIGQIDYILSENEKSSSIFYGKVDSDKIGAAGHSQGGRSTVNAAVADSRIKAAVSIAGSNTSSERSGLTTPTLFLTGSSDFVVYAPLWVKPTYKKAEGPAAYASLSGGIHTSVITNYDSIIYYTAKWMDAYLNNNNDSRKVFMEGGELFTDSAWKDVTSKSVEPVQTASIFGSGSVTAVIVIVLVLICAAAVALIVKNRRSKHA